MIQKNKILFAIRSLDVGGAEKLVIDLIKNIDKSKYEIKLCTMYKGAMDEEAKYLLGKSFICLNKTGRYDLITFFTSYVKAIKNFNPDVIYSHIGEMNLFSLLSKLFIRKSTKIVWCVHSAYIDYKSYGKLFQFIFWLQKILSKYANKVVYVSQSSKQFHIDAGYCKNNCVVINNGVDTNFYTPSQELRNDFRNNFCISKDTKVIGIAARIDRMKGYPLLSIAAKSILEQDNNILFVSAGSGDNSIKNECETILGKYSNKFIWLGYIKDLRSFYNGIDIFVLPSYGEAFGLTVAEAISCGKTAVVSSAGEMKNIVNDDRFVFSIGDEEGLKNALKFALENCSTQTFNENIKNFDIMKTVSNTLLELFNDK